MPVDAALEHIEDLKARGYNFRRIERVSGVSESTIRNLAGLERMHSSAEAKILSVPLDLVEEDGLTGWVPCVGVRRRLQSLRAMGYTSAQLSRRLGISPTSIANILHEDGVDPSASVKAKTAKNVDKLWRELQFKPPPQGGFSNHTRRDAVARGWYPPLAWDEDRIDDPDAQPHDVDRTDEVDWWENYLDLRSMGVEPRAAADRLGLPWKTLYGRIRLRELRAS